MKVERRIGSLGLEMLAFVVPLLQGPGGEVPVSLSEIINSPSEAVWLIMNLQWVLIKYDFDYPIRTKAFLLSNLRTVAKRAPRQYLSRGAELGGKR